ncbi:MAG: hypothetical protein ACREBJ_02660 [Nitrosotalea sp.]
MSSRTDDIRSSVKTSWGNFSHVFDEEFDAANQSRMQDVWPMYDEGVLGMANSFDRVAPGGFISYLTSKFPPTYNGGQGITVVELGGPSSRFTDQLANIVRVKKSIGVTVIDARSPEQKIADSQRNHRIVPVIDAFSTKDVVREIGQIIEGSGLRSERFNKNGVLYGSVDMLLMRMGGAITTLDEETDQTMTTVPQNVYAQFQAFAEMYRLLSREGVAFVQLPYSLLPILPEYLSLLRREQQGKLDVSVAIDTNGYLVMRMQKLEGAPEELPALSVETVNKIAQTYDASSIAAIMVLRKFLLPNFAIIERMNALPHRFRPRVNRFEDAMYEFGRDIRQIGTSTDALNSFVQLCQGLDISKILQDAVSKGMQGYIIKLFSENTLRLLFPMLQGNDLSELLGTYVGE